MRALILLSLLFLTGCATLEDSEGPIKAVIAAFKKAAPVADPLTGGMATPIAGAAGTLSMGLFAVNRWLLARKRGNVIKEVHDHPDTPDVLDQVKSAVARKVIIQIIGKNPCIGTENPV